MSPRPNAFPQRLVRAAGAVVWRPLEAAASYPPGHPMSADEFEVLMVHRPRYRDWAWPKGKAELGEPMPQAAVREVEEEAGVTVALRAPLTSQRYRLGSGSTKEVRYWVGELLEDSPMLAARPPVIAASMKEIDKVRWMSPAKARQMLTRRGDRRLLNEVVNRAERGQLRTSTITILRHAKAVGRAGWEGTESDRRLSRLGSLQALDLVPALSAFGADRVISSPWLRCVQTVDPYVCLSQVPLETDDRLTETAVDSNPALAAALIRDILAVETGNCVVSVHRPSLPILVDALSQSTPRQRFPAWESTHLSTAEMFVVHVSHAGTTEIVDVEKHGTFTKTSLR